MAHLTTHVLDTARGMPAAGVTIDLDAVSAPGRRHICTVTTNQDGRTDQPLLSGDLIAAGVYELTFHAGEYLRRSGLPATSLPATSLPAIGLPATGLPATSLPATSLPATGLPATSLPATSLPATGLPASSLPATGLPATDPMFFDLIVIRFGIADPAGLYHVPLLLSPYGYTTYRGS
jgi:5-hydroxyisourate hydrolase-like protein (transthyretin family)